MKLWQALLLLGLCIQPARGQTEVGELVRQATKCVEANQFQQAIALFEQVTATHPELLEPWLQLGELYRDEGRYDRSRECYQQALQKTPDRFSVEVELAHLLRLQERFEEALQALQQLRQQKPENLEVLLTLAQTYQDLDQPLPALELYDLILGRQPDNVPALVGRARVQAESNPVQAEQTLDDYLASDSSNADARLAKAGLYMDEERWKEAQEQISAVLLTHPENSAAYLNQAQFWRRQGWDDRAEQAYRDGLRWAPQQRQLSKGLADLQREHAPALEPIARRYRDSSGNHMDSLGARFSFDLDRLNRVWLVDERRSLSQPSLGSRSLQFLEAGWNGRVSEDLFVQARVGSTQGLATGGLELHYTPTSQDRLTFHAQNQVLVDTLQLSQNAVRFQDLGIYYRHQFTPEDQLEIGYGRGFFSDNNQRNAYNFGYFHTFQRTGPLLSLGVAGRSLAYAHPTNLGYFSPDQFHTAQILFRLDNHVPDDPWMYSLEAGIGKQTGGQTITSLSGSLGYRFNDHFEIEASSLSSNSSLGTNAGFSYSLQTLRMLLRF